MNNHLRIEVFVSWHKQEPIKMQDYEIPVLAGSMRKINAEKFILRSDNSLLDHVGDHISERNHFYSELTVLYWVWKNRVSDYQGFCHYRRRFNLHFNQIASILKQYDFILPYKENLRDSVENQYLSCHDALPWHIAINELAYLYPDYLETAEAVFNNNKLYPYNIFITSRKNLVRYCSWLFSLLFRIESKVGEKYLFELNSYQKRFFGFLAERLFTLYLSHNKFKLMETELIDENKHAVTQALNDKAVNQIIYKLKTSCKE